MTSHSKLPVEIRLLATAFVVFFFYKIVIRGEILHTGVALGGRGGYPLPRVEAVIVTCLSSCFLLFSIWRESEALSDLKELWFHIRHPGRIETLFRSVRSEYPGDSR